MNGTSKRIISLILALTLMFSLVAMPVQAAQENAPAAAARELISGLKRAAAAAQDYEDERQESGGIQETEPEPEPEKSITSLDLIMPGEKLLYVASSNGEPVLTAYSAVPTETASREQPVDWSKISLTDIAAFDGNGALKEGCVLYFMLNNGPDSVMRITDTDGNVISINGVDTFAELPDADHDFICDVCGRCIGGCTGDEEYYTEDDVEHTDADGNLYNAAGTVIGREITAQIEYSTGETETQTVKQFYTYSVDKDHLCNVCGSHLCGTPENGYAHDYSDGKCDVCGRCTDGCKDELLNKTVEGSDGTKTQTTDGNCDVCGLSMSGDPCDHIDSRGSESCNSCGALTCASRHMTDTELGIAAKYMSSVCTYLSEAVGGELDEGYKTALSNWLDSYFIPFAMGGNPNVKGTSYYNSLRTELKLVQKRCEDIEAYLGRLDGFDAQTVTAAELVGKLNKDGSIDHNGSFYGILLDKQKTLLENRDAASDEAKGYYQQKLDILGSFSSAPEELNTLVGRVLDRELAAVFGKDYCGGALTIDGNNAELLKYAVSNVEEAAICFLYPESYKLNTNAQAAAKVWSGETELSRDPEARRCTLYHILSFVQNGIKDAGEKAFTPMGFETKTFDENGLAPYAVRTPVERDMARIAGEDYAVYDAQIQKVIASLDGFLASEECAELLILLLGDKLGSVSDVDGDGKLLLYDIIVSALMSKLLTDENITYILKNAFSTAIRIIDDLPDTLARTVSSIENKGDRLVIDAYDLLGTAVIGTGSWFGILMDVLGNTCNITLRMDGNGTSRSLKNVLGDAGIELYPDQFRAVLGKFNGDGRYNTAIAQLSGKSSWESVGTLDFGIESVQDAKELVSVILGCLEPVIKIAFSGYGSHELRLDKAANISINGFLLGLIINIPVFISVDGNVKANIDSMDLYGRVLTPIFEALGVDPSQCVKPTFTGNTVSDMMSAAEALLSPVKALLTEISKHPVSSLLGILPNLSLYLQNGKLFDLLDFSTGFSLHAFDMQPSASQLGQNFVDMIEDAIFAHWYDCINPIKWIEFGIATVAYWLMVPLFLGVVAIFEAVDLDLTDLISLISLDISNFVDALANSAFDRIPGIIDPLVNRVLDELGLSAVRFKLPDINWPDTPYALTTKGPELTELNFSRYLRATLCCDEAQRAFGFRLDRPATVVGFVLSCLCDVNGNRLFDTAALTDAMSFDELSHLGKCVKLSGSARSAGYYSHWNGLSSDNGEYYFVKADTSDVFFWLMKAVAGLLSSEQNIRGFMTVLGLDEEKIDGLLSDVEALIEEKAGLSLALKKLLGDFCDENGKLTFKSVCESVSAEKLTAVITELMLSDGAYELKELIFAEAEENRAQEIAERSGLPALDYDNLWNRSLASLLSDDLDDLVNKLLAVLNGKDGKDQTVQEIADELIDKTLSDPQLLGIVTQLIFKLTGKLAADPKICTVLDLAAELDVTPWAKDFGYLFDESFPAPQDKYFTRLGAEMTDDGIVWTLDGNIVDTPEELLTALGELIRPLEPVLDLLLCGGRLEVLPYTPQGYGYRAGSLLTVNGGEGYNNAVLPMLEAMLGPGCEGILTAAQFKAMGSVDGVVYCVGLVLDYVRNGLLTSETPVGDLMAMLAQLLYALSENGITVLVTELMRPLFVLLDVLRPIANIDLNDAVNELICQLTYKLGGYASSDAMRGIMEDRNAELDLRHFSLKSLFSMLSVVISAEKGGIRVYFEAHEIYDSAIKDLAFLRESYTSRSVKNNRGTLTSEPVTAYRLNISGMDAMTAIISMFAEMFVCGDNAYAMDNALGLKGLLISLKRLLTEAPAYTSDYDWAYLAGNNASAKAALLRAAKDNGSVKVDDFKLANDKKAFETYIESFECTDWDEAFARALMTDLDDLISGVLNIETGSGTLIEMLLPEIELIKHGDHYTFGSLVESLLAAVVTDEGIDKVLYAVSDLLAALTDSEKAAELLSGLGIEDTETLAALSEELFPYIKKLIGALGIDPGFYETDKEKTVYSDTLVTYYNSNGEPTGLVRERLASDLSNLGAVLADIFTPFTDIICFVMISQPIELFNATSELINGRGEAVIRIPGFEGYNYLALPILEAMGVKDLKSAEYYKNGGEYKSDEFVRDLFGAVAGEISYILSDKDGTQVLDKLIELLPAFIYLINADGIGVAAKNLISALEALVDAYNSAMELLGKDDAIVSLESIKALFSDFGIGSIIRTLFAWLCIDSDDLLGNAASGILEALKNVLKGVPALEAGSKTGEHFVLSDFFYELYENFAIGEIVYLSDSACTYDTYTMRFASAHDKAVFITVLAGSVMDIIEAPENAAVLTELLGRDVYQSVINVFNLSAFEFTPFDINWLFTEYADTGKLISAFELSDKLRTEPLYGELWTPEKAQELACDLDSFLEDTLYLLGLKLNGMTIRDFESLFAAIFGGAFYNERTVNRIAALLGQVKVYLDKYDPTGGIADLILGTLDIDLHAWDDYAPGGKYENGRDWGFAEESLTPEKVRENSAVFEDAISELLAPAAPIIAFVLAGRDETFLIDGDGLGANAKKIQLTIVGAEGYKYGIVPLLETIGVDTDDIYDPDEYSRRAAEDHTYAIKGVLHPVIAKLNELGSNTLQEFFELIPELIYFLNCGGFGNMIENLLHSIYVIGNALSPLKERISQLAYDETGIFDLYNTLDLTGIADKALFDFFRISKDDLIRVYNASGGNYEEVDSFEDIDLRLIMSVVFALVDSMLGDIGTDLVLMPFASSLVNELSYGYLVSFDSKTGRDAYKMELGEDVTPQTLGDLFTLLMRTMLEFLAQGKNVDAVMELIKNQTDISEMDYIAVYAILRLIGVTLASGHSIQGAMMVVWYTVHGSATVSGLAVKEYTKINSKWAAVMAKLATKNDGIAKQVFDALLSIAGDRVDDILDDQQIAPHGFIYFFKDSFRMITDFYNSIRQTFTNLFHRIFSWW